MKQRADEQHGQARSPTYRSWDAMRQRCLNPRAPDWGRYGGRGITVCENWKTSFATFFANMGERPAGTTLDRIDNDGPYFPANCRWATGSEQQSNTCKNRWITHNGKRQTITQWARQIGLTPTGLRMRINHGWTLDEALSLSRQR